MSDHEFVRRLFAQAPTIDLSAFDEPPARQGNHVPAEGATTSRTRPADHDARDTAGHLFGVHPNARNLHHDPDAPQPPHTTENL